MKSYIFVFALAGIFAGNVFAQVVAIDATHVRVPKTVYQTVTLNQLENAYYMASNEVAILGPEVNQAIIAISQMNQTSNSINASI